MLTRRAFLVRATATLWGGPRLLRDWHRPIAVMGVGGVGAAVVRRLRYEKYPARYWVWDSAEPPRPAGERVAIVPESILRHHRSNILIPRAVADALDRVPEEIAGQTVVMVVGLGGLAGSLIMPALARLLESRCERLALAWSFPIRQISRPHRPWLASYALAECEGVNMYRLVVNTFGLYKRVTDAAGHDSMGARARFVAWAEKELGRAVHNAAVRAPVVSEFAVR